MICIPHVACCVYPSMYPKHHPAIIFHIAPANSTHSTAGCHLEHPRSGLHCLHGPYGSSYMSLSHSGCCHPAAVLSQPCCFLTVLLCFLTALLLFCYGPAVAVGLPPVPSCQQDWCQEEGSSTGSQCRHQHRRQQHSRRRCSSGSSCCS